MSYIPDTRNRYEDFLYTHTRKGTIEKTNNPYWQRYLDKKSRIFMAGWDWVTRDAVFSFFYNLDSEDIEEMLGVQFDSDEKKKLTIEITEALRQKLAEWIEGERDMMVVSLIDNMSDKKYNKNVKRENEKASETDLWIEKTMDCLLSGHNREDIETPKVMIEWGYHELENEHRHRAAGVYAKSDNTIHIAGEQTLWDICYTLALTWWDAMHRDHEEIENSETFAELVMKEIGMPDEERNRIWRG